MESQSRIIENCGVVANELDCDGVVSLKSGCSIDFTFILFLGNECILIFQQL